MALRKGHGTGAGVPRIEVLPPNELPAPKPATAAPLARTVDGKIADSNAAKELGRRGGLAKAGKIKLLTSLGLADVAEDSAFKPYDRAGSAFVAMHLQYLAKCAGGNIGPGPSSIVCTAGMQLAASRYIFDLAVKSADPRLFHRASVLGNDSRQNLLAAYELARREGDSFKDEGDPFADFFEKSEEPDHEG